MFYMCSYPVQIDFNDCFVYCNYSKPCLKRPLKIDKTKILMANGCLMNVESAPLGAFCNTFDFKRDDFNFEIVNFPFLDGDVPR